MQVSYLRTYILVVTE